VKQASGGDTPSVESADTNTWLVAGDLYAAGAGHDRGVLVIVEGVPGVVQFGPPERVVGVQPQPLDADVDPCQETGIDSVTGGAPDFDDAPSRVS
jgi:hypothetical protein